MVKVKVPLSMPRKYTGGTEVYVHSFLTSALDWSTCSTWRPGRLTLQKWTPVPIEQKGRCAPQPVCVIWTRDKMSWALPGTQTPDCPAHSTVTILSSCSSGTQTIVYFFKLFYVIFPLCKFTSIRARFLHLLMYNVGGTQAQAQTSVRWNHTGRCQWVSQ